jgi:hypothetical protein
MDAQAVAIRRVTLVADVTTPIYPPREAQDVTIGNATPGDVVLYSTPDEPSAFLVIAAGFERQLTVRHIHFRSGQVAFWLTANNDGEVVLIWV